MKARVTSTTTEEILAMRFGHESDSQAFKDFMEHAYLLDRQITSLRNQPTGLNNQSPAFQDPNIPPHDARHGHPRLDRKTSTASFKLATQQQFPGGGGPYGNQGIGLASARTSNNVGPSLSRGVHVNVVPMTESNLRTHDKLHPPKKRSVKNWLDHCMALQEGRSPNNMKTVNDPSHMDYITKRLVNSGR